MRYVIGDVHGQYNALMELLDYIQPKDNDHIYFIGDLIDRGPYSLSCLKIAMKLQSEGKATIIKGNHESMLERSMSIGRITNGHLDNGGAATWAQIETLTTAERERMFEWLQSLPDCVVLDDIKTVLVHGGIRTKEGAKDLAEVLERNGESLEWERPRHVVDMSWCGQTFGYDVVVGHTPVQLLSTKAGGIVGDIVNLDYATHQVYMIDCGASMAGDKRAQPQLACLRLEDKQEFYVMLY